MAGSERKGTFKVETLKGIEAEMQAVWETEKLHEINAPSNGGRRTTDDGRRTTDGGRRTTP